MTAPRIPRRRAPIYWPAAAVYLAVPIFWIVVIAIISGFSTCGAGDGL